MRRHVTALRAFGTAALLLGILALVGCSAGSESPPKHRQPQLTPLAQLLNTLRCTQTPTPTAIQGIPGATAVPCVGTSRAYLNWSTAYINAQYDLRSRPGPPPDYAELVTFRSIGARKVYARQGAQTQQETPAARQVDSAEGQLPDVVGRNWIVSGNDPAVDTRAINNKGLAVAPPTPTDQATPVPSSIQPAISCKIHYAGPGNTTTYTLDALTYRGPVTVKFFGQKGNGSPAIRPFHTVDVTVRSQEKTRIFPVADDQPVGEAGASAPPDTCQASTS